MVPGWLPDGGLPCPSCGFVLRFGRRGFGRAAVGPQFPGPPSHCGNTVFIARQSRAAPFMAANPFRRPEKKPPALWPVWLILAAIAPVMAYFYMTRTGPQVPRALEPSRLTVTGEIAVVDGDTVRHQGQLYRLVGFDTPEKGDLARCEQERRLAEKATQRLRQLIISSNADLRASLASADRARKGRRAAITGDYAAHSQSAHAMSDEFLSTRGWPIRMFVAPVDALRNSHGVSGEASQ